MADLDLSFIAEDADWSVPVTVTRRALTVGQNGRGSTTSQTITIPHATVTPASPRTLKMLSDAQNLSDSIEIRSSFQWNLASAGKLPDLVAHDGLEYEVIGVQNFASVGYGITVALATLRSLTE